jgi:hypothetical protein
MADRTIRRASLAVRGGVADTAARIKSAGERLGPSSPRKIWRASPVAYATTPMTKIAPSAAVKARRNIIVPSTRITGSRDITGISDAPCCSVPVL